MKHLLWLLTLLAALPAAAQLQQIQRFEPTLQVKSPVIGDINVALSAALAGNHLAIGYPLADIDSKNDSGLVLVVHPDTGKLIRIIRESTPDNEAEFGASVAISGNLLAVGAPNYQGGRGAAFVFNLTTGKQLLRIINSANAPTGFGSAVAIAGDRLVVGMPDNNGPGAFDQPGRVAIYSIATGQELMLLQGLPSEVGDRFGDALAIQGRQLAVGAPRATSNAQSEAGAVYLFDLETGARQTRLQASDPTQGANFGRFLAYARQHLTATARNALYAIDARSFSQTRRIAAPANNTFGKLACLGMTSYVSVNFGNDSSALHTYDLLNGTLLESWIPGAAVVGFGASLAVDHQRLIAGTVLEVCGPALVTTGGIYSRHPPVASEPLQSLGTIKPQISPAGFGTALGVSQMSIRPNGKAGLISRFKNPAPGVSKGAYLVLDGVSIYTVPVALVGTMIGLDGIAGVGSVTPTDLTEFRVNHPEQTVFLGTARSNLGLFPGSVPFIGVIGANWPDRFALRRAGNDAAGPGSGKIAAFLDLAQSRGLGFDADLATCVRLQIGVDGVTQSSDSAVLLISTDHTLPQTTLAGAKEGTQDPSSAGITFGQINPQVTFATGLACFTAFRQALSVDNQATYSIDRAGNTQRFVTRGDVTGAGTVQTLLGISANINNERLVRFTTALGNGVNASNNEVLVTETGLILRKGSPYPGGPSGLVWNRLLGFHPARASNLIVHATLRGPKVTAANDGVVTLFESGNPPLTLMREGDLVPGHGTARIGTILRVDAQSGDPSGSYLILATLTGVPADSNLALFSGRSSFGNNVILTPKLPVLMLRKGQWTRRPAGFPGRLAGLQLPGKNTNTAGFGGTGHFHWQGGDGKAVMQLDWNTNESELVRASW